MSPLASKIISIVLLVALRKAKRDSSISEIEFLAQNIVNQDLIAALRMRFFHREWRNDIPNYSKYSPSGTYLRASIFRSPINQSQSFAQMTLDIMKKYGKNLEPFQGTIQSFSNMFQYFAVRELLLSGTNISNSINLIAQFSNWYQVAALQIMIDANREFIPSLSSIIKLSNEHQVQAINYAVSSKSESIAEMIEKLAMIDNPYQAKAIMLLVTNAKMILPQLDKILTIEDADQWDQFRQAQGI